MYIVSGVCENSFNSRSNVCLTEAWHIALMRGSIAGNTEDC